ncbi:MAG: molybdopterin oxidoreductase family protein, partial [Polyangiaceae bacterium]
MERELLRADAIEARSVKTHCPYCAFQCGMTVTRSPDDGGSLRVSGDEEFPVNRGQMCIKGFTSAQLLQRPDRLTSPIVRDRAGRRTNVAWDAALDFIARRLVEVRADHGPEAVAVFGSGALTNEKAYLLGKFARVALRSPNIDYNGRYCMASAAAGQLRAFGVDRGLPFPVSDIARAGTLALWGSNCADTMPPIMQWVREQRERGGASIVVDPRRTETARSATLHLQLTPGTDLALANGLLHIALVEGLIDHAYIRDRTTGFDSVRRDVLSSDPAQVERLTGVSIEDQVRAVRLLASRESGMVLSGRGPEQQSKGTDTVSALINLMLALGRVGKPFSGYGCLTGQGNGQGGREHGQKAGQLPGYRRTDDPEHRAAIARVWGVDADALQGEGKSAYELLDSIGEIGGIRALLVFGSNVAVASPNATNIERKLRALDLLVVCDAFENETSEAAHAILPVAQWAEEEGTMTNLEGRVILRQKVKPSPEGVGTDIDVLCGLAARLGVGDKFQ